MAAEPGREVDGVAAELVRLRAERVEEPHGVRRRAQRPVDDRRGDENPPALVLPRAVREEELGRRVVVDLDAERRQEVVRLVEDPGDEGVFEKAEGGFHGASSGAARRGA